MKFWLAFPLFALAQASCYDYEYYDPDTGSSIPGNACANKAAGATVGQPAAPSQTQFGAQPQFATAQTQFSAQPQFATAQTQFSAQPQFGAQIASAPAAFSAPAASSVYGAVYSAPAATYAPAAPVYGAAPAAPIYGASFTSTPASTSFYTAPAASVNSAPAASVYTTAPVSTVYGSIAAAPVYGATVTARPAITSTYGAPVTAYGSAAVGGQVRTQAQSDQVSQLEYYKRVAERQARQHKQNSRAVQEASKDLSRSSLVNRLVAGSGNAAPWYPAVRLESQKDAADAYKSEKRIANKNAEDAYQRFQQNPTRLNMLVSKYQDKHADLTDAAYQYNVVNSATFGQRLATTSILGGLSTLGGGLFGQVTQIITQKQQSEDLQDIQRDMQRIARQIQTEAKAQIQQQTGGSTAVQQGSVQQRMMALNTYGPQTQSRSG